MHIIRRALLGAAAILAAGPLAAMFAGTASAAWPDRPVRLVVPWAPGGNVDIVNRIVAAAMSDDLKQSVIVENRPGANGAVGMESVSRAAPWTNGNPVSVRPRRPRVSRCWPKR